jgi:hypothetical protein
MKFITKFNIVIWGIIGLIAVGFASFITIAVLNGMGIIPDATAQPIMASISGILYVVIFGAMVVPFILVSEE